MNADADNVTRVEGGGVELFQSFVANDGVAKCLGGSGGKDVEPSGSNDGGAKRHITGVDEMNA